MQWRAATISDTISALLNLLDVMTVEHIIQNKKFKIKKKILSKFSNALIVSEIIAFTRCKDCRAHYS